MLDMFCSKHLKFLQCGLVPTIIAQSFGCVWTSFSCLWPIKVVVYGRHNGAMVFKMSYFAFLFTCYFLNFKSKDFISFPIKIKKIYFNENYKTSWIRSCIEFEILPHKEFRPIEKDRRNNCWPNGWQYLSIAQKMASFMTKDCCKFSWQSINVEFILFLAIKQYIIPDIKSNQHELAISKIIVYHIFLLTQIVWWLLKVLFCWYGFRTVWLWMLVKLVLSM